MLVSNSLLRRGSSSTHPSDVVASTTAVLARHSLCTSQRLRRCILPSDSVASTAGSCLTLLHAHPSDSVATSFPATPSLEPQRFSLTVRYAHPSDPVATSSAILAYPQASPSDSVVSTTAIFDHTPICTPQRLRRYIYIQRPVPATPSLRPQNLGSSQHRSSDSVVSTSMIFAQFSSVPATPPLQLLYRQWWQKDTSTTPQPQCHSRSFEARGRASVSVSHVVVVPEVRLSLGTQHPTEVFPVQGTAATMVQPSGAFGARCT